MLTFPKPPPCFIYLPPSYSHDLHSRSSMNLPGYALHIPRVLPVCLLHLSQPYLTLTPTSTPDRTSVTTDRSRRCAPGLTACAVCCILCAVPFSALHIHPFTHPQPMLRSSSGACPKQSISSTQKFPGPPKEVSQVGTST